MAATTTTDPAVQKRLMVSTAELGILKQYLSMFTNRRLPYVIFGLAPNMIVYTNVTPNRFNSYLRVMGNDAYHFVRFKTPPEITALMYKLWPELADGPFIVNGPLLVNVISHAFEPIAWVKTEDSWAIEVLVAPKKHEDAEEGDEDQQEDGEEKETKPTIKHVEHFWFRSPLMLSPVLEHHKLLGTIVDNPNSAKFDLDPRQIEPKDLTFIRISEKPLSYIGALEYYVRYPLLDGETCVSIFNYHRKVKPERFQFFILTWLDSKILRTMTVYDNDFVTVWSYTPGTVWFQSHKVVTRPAGDTAHA